jgi:splicing factor 3A subunit 3
VDLEAFDSSEDVQVLGTDRIKQALVALGLKAGGTLQQRAERLMMTKGKTLEELDPKLFAKGKAPVKNAQDAERRSKISHVVALLECKIQTLIDLLQSTLKETKKQVEKKATSTYDELVADMEDVQDGGGDPTKAGNSSMEGDDDDEDDDQDIIYNPLKLPLGWDGKPIPYWLYKLHGLNQEFKCEICGNYSYWGRRAFEKHFKEFRHQHGMRCLGIPNNKVFSEVTKIDDAKALWQTLQKEQQNGFSQDQDEEFEDKEGNVYNKKTYMDLQRQGLL